MENLKQDALFQAMELFEEVRWFQDDVHQRDAAVVNKTWM